MYIPAQGVKKPTKEESEMDKFPNTRVCDSESEDDEQTDLMKKKRLKNDRKGKEKKKKKKKKIRKKKIEEEEEVIQNEPLKQARSMDDLRDTGEFPIRKARSVDDLLSSKRRRVSEIKQIMYENAKKIRDRNGKLDDLMEKGSRLEMSAEVFFQKTKEIKKKAFWKLWKFWIILGVVIGVVVVVIIIAVIVVLTNQNSTETRPQVKTVTLPPP
ncbi:hypothetical protein FSP39_022442 [Pinctada imbricata]|uniref:V-SNARE coiled-coil homology domain-containing protein n=1 Tax=Pinctada imbricata TaxID=66713 RepID=A0AA88XWR5_PINIB|nr:hypothetical protein FSP39_022442 [Pinctada imbricata]